ncbi:hypothetical protein CDD80_7336 [Ophiocordyceps camponoti-rufipedis]|uniref:Actin-like ATPase domain-containing protein n=1 Tax=Ophiocordyceps camponoti-rufipedis TaxID=2004952 RepID=A0A2C5YM60_9HYPO|nr:hypothetical protein CDD80_7336 [Ophiocordyceps camponoti-rufipedis]
MPSLKRKAPAAPRCIFIGLDFGTTHSGLAWAVSADDITVISDWSSHDIYNNDKKKAPSTLLYNGDANEAPLWGYSIPSHEVPLKWFKLLLLDDEDIPDHILQSDHVQQARRLMQRSNRHACHLVGDYIKQLWNFGMSEIERAIGRSQLSVTPFDLTVTIPAIWPLYARNRMQQAIKHAGIMKHHPSTRLSFVSEPEAAAVAAMHDFCGRADIKKNDNFVVCDAGGGTVDIISYKCHRESPMQLQESVKGDGKLCGAIFLDERFRDLIQQRIPPATQRRMGRDGMQQFITQAWEQGIKIQTRSDVAGVDVPFPWGTAAEEDVKCSKMTFSKDDIGEIYRPVVAEVVGLVVDQITQVKKKARKDPKYVILVGGFGMSRILYENLQRAMATGKFKTEVLQSGGEKPWTAVCRGAVLRGMNKVQSNPWATIDARVARASFGTTVNIVPWTMGEHDVRDREWCALEGEFLAVNQVQWFIEMGETLAVNAPVSKAFWQDLEAADNVVETEIVTSMQTPPPYRHDISVTRLCLIRWSRVPEFDHLPLYTNEEGRVIRQIPYQIKMVPNGISLDFEIFFEGVMVASKNVSVETNNDDDADNADDD